MYTFLSNEGPSLETLGLQCFPVYQQYTNLLYFDLFFNAA